VCSGVTQPQGTPCNDNNACTTGDACNGDTCQGLAVDCPLDQCDQSALCDPANGGCAYVSKADGTGCDDGDPCTLIDTCQVGACQGGSPAMCPDLGPCFEPGLCDSQTGMCSSPPVADGTACDVAPDDCVQGGTCLMGVCQEQLVADGNACDDMNPCSNNDTCLGGTCKGVSTFDGVPCPGGLCIAGTCFEEPGGSGSGGAGGGAGGGGVGGGSGGSSGVGGAGGVQGGGGTGASGSNSDGPARLHGGACGVARSPGLDGSGFGAAASASGIGLLIGLFARRRRRAG